MSQISLTELSIRALKGTDTYVTHFDKNLPGFGVRVGKRTKTYVAVVGRERRRVSIGKFGDISLAEARKEAMRLLSADPEKQDENITFSKARDRFLEEHYRDKAAHTKYQVTRCLSRHFKALESTQLADITDASIKRALDKLSDRPSEQLHAYRYLRTFLTWCTRPPRRFIKHSPMEGYEPPGTDKRGTRTLSDDELKAIWNASNSPRTAIFRLMVLWGTRNSETCLIEREWVRDGVLTIPGRVTKNGREHSIPVLPMADEVLTLAGGSNQYYFPGRWGEGHLTHHALPKLKAEVMKLSKTKNWQLRDIRRTFRSNMARLKVPREVCEVLINHAPPVLDDIYDRYDRLEEKREALAKYEAFIQSLIARD